MTEIAKFVKFPRNLEFCLSLGQGFSFLDESTFSDLGCYSKSPFVVRIFGQMASRPSRPSRWALLLLLFASKAELLPEICEPKLGPDLIQILGSDKRVIVIGYSCQISQEVGIVEEYFCIQIRSVDRRETGFLSRQYFCRAENKISSSASDLICGNREQRTQRLAASE